VADESGALGTVGLNWN